MEHPSCLLLHHQLVLPPAEQLLPSSTTCTPRGPVARSAGGWPPKSGSASPLLGSGSLPLHHGPSSMVYRVGLTCYPWPPSHGLTPALRVDSLAVHSLHQPELDLLRPQRPEHALPPVLPPLQVDHEDLWHRASVGLSSPKFPTLPPPCPRRPGPPRQSPSCQASWQAPRQTGRALLGGASLRGRKKPRGCLGHGAGERSNLFPLRPPHPLHGSVSL